MPDKLTLKVTMLDFWCQLHSNSPISLRIGADLENTLCLVEGFPAGIISVTCYQVNSWENLVVQDDLPAAASTTMNALITSLQVMLQVAIQISCYKYFPYLVRNNSLYPNL